MARPAPRAPNGARTLVAPAPSTDVSVAVGMSATKHREPQFVVLPPAGGVRPGCLRRLLERSLGRHVRDEREGAFRIADPHEHALHEQVASEAPTGRGL